MVSWLLPALACTPLGAWLYYHPSVTVARVRVDARAEGKLPVVIALDMQNPNDYTISATRVELELVLDSLPIGRVKKDEKLVVPGAGTARLALPLEPDRRASPAAGGVPVGGPPVQRPGPGDDRDPVREAGYPVCPGGRSGVRRRASFASIRSTRSKCVTVSVTAPNSSSTFPRKMNGP